MAVYLHGHFRSVLCHYSVSEEVEMDWNKLTLTIFFPKHILKNKIRGIVFIGFYSKDLDEENKSARSYNGNGGLSASCPISWFGIKTEVKRNYKRTK